MASKLNRVSKVSLRARMRGEKSLVTLEFPFTIRSAATFPDIIQGNRHIYYSLSRKPLPSAQLPVQLVAEDKRIIAF